MSRRRRGFTLFELMIVIALILIISALGAPLVFQGMDGQTKVNAAADMVRAQWATCRSHAIEESRPYRFAVIPNSGKFKIEPYKGPLENSDMLSTDTNSVNDATPGFSIEDVLPKPVRFGTKEAPAELDSPEADGEYVTVAIFMPNGTTTEDAEILFGAKGSSVVTLQLRHMMGTATTIRGNRQEDSK